MQSGATNGVAYVGDRDPPPLEPDLNGDAEQRQPETRRELDSDPSISGSLEVDSNANSASMTSLLVPVSGLTTLEVDVDAELGSADEDEDEDDDYDGDDASVYAISTYPRVHAAYQVEHPYENGPDSATIDSARTLYAEDIDYVWEHGRRYCGEWHMPNDEDEQTRLYIVHQVYLALFNLELTTVPLDNPTHILDIGTGIGEWAIDMAEKYPRCEVFGTDIASIQPTMQVPSNVEFQIDNAEDEWIRPADTFDLVHLRNMAGAFPDWTFIYSEAFNCVKPGGWIEILDFDDHRAFQNFLSFYSPDSPIHLMSTALREASEMSGRPYGVAHMDPKLLIDAGFVDVKELQFDMGLGSHANSNYGYNWLLASVAGIEARCLRLLTKYKGWDGNVVRRLCDEVALETKRLSEDPIKAKRFAVKLRVLAARKPMQPGLWSAQSLNENGEIHEYSGDDSTIGSRSNQTGISEDTV